MPIDLTWAEPDGLQIHIRMNSLLSEYGFFKTMSPEQKIEFDDRAEKIISEYLPYSEDDESTAG